MKKKAKWRQERRQRALDRFSITPLPPGATPDQQAAYTLYTKRKQLELAALQHSLGLKSNV